MVELSEKLQRSHRIILFNQENNLYLNEGWIQVVLPILPNVYLSMVTHMVLIIF